MLKALVVKELRESAGIVALTILALIFALAELTGTPILPWQSRGTWNFPFVYDSLAFYLSVCVGGMAAALGLKQTAWEERQGTFFFLLHRPVSRGRVFASKLLVGLGWVSGLSAVFLLIYACWAGRPGHVAVPFAWSMTTWAWQQWIVMPLIYLGAFLAGIRPARWWGTRLAPLAAGMLMAVVAVNMPWLWLTLLLAIVFSAPLVGAIYYYVGRRDY